MKKILFIILASSLVIASMPLSAEKQLFLAPPGSTIFMKSKDKKGEIKAIEYEQYERIISAINMIYGSLGHREESVMKLLADASYFAVKYVDPNMEADGDNPYLNTKMSDKDRKILMSVGDKLGFKGIKKNIEKLYEISKNSRITDVKQLINQVKVSLEKLIELEQEVSENMKQISFKNITNEEEIGEIKSIAPLVSQAKTLMQKLYNYIHAREEQAGAGINSVVNDTKVFLAQNYHRAHIAKKLSIIPAPEELVVAADPLLLRNMLIEYCINADKAKTKNITIATRRDGDDAVIEIRDTGRGIARYLFKEGVLPDRFRMFDMGATSRKGEEGGSGLAFSWWFISDCGGTITVQSEQGKGTIFTIRLPVTPPNPNFKHNVSNDNISPEIADLLAQLTIEQQNQFYFIRKFLKEHTTVEIKDIYFAPFEDLIYDEIAYQMASMNYFPTINDKLTFMFKPLESNIAETQFPDISHAIICFGQKMLERDLNKLIETVDNRLGQEDEDFSQLLKEISQSTNVEEVKQLLHSKQLDLSTDDVEILIKILKSEPKRLQLPMLKSKQILTYRGCVLDILTSEIAHALEMLWKNRYGILIAPQKNMYLNDSQQRKLFEKKGYKLTKYPALFAQFIIAEAIDILWQIIHSQAYEFVNVTHDYPDLSYVFDYTFVDAATLIQIRTDAYEYVIATIKAKVGEWKRNGFIEPDYDQITKILLRFIQYIIFTDLETEDTTKDLLEIHTFLIAKQLCLLLLMPDVLEMESDTFRTFAELEGAQFDQAKEKRNMQANADSFIKQHSDILGKYYPEIFSLAGDKLKKELKSHVEQKEKELAEKGYFQIFLKELKSFKTPHAFLSRLGEKIDEAKVNAQKARPEDFEVIDLLERLKTEINSLKNDYPLNKFINKLSQKETKRSM